MVFTTIGGLELLNADNPVSASIRLNHSVRAKVIGAIGATSEG
ncbi:hypothetical protein [Microbulbifer elongatus]|nr:hypothetical protein [Microbulbifer elongatus]